MRFDFRTLTLVWLLVTGSVRADDWPAFRGPNGQGNATGSLPMTWGPTQNVAWKQPIPGRGWSSPVVALGRVYLTTAIPAEDGSKEISLRVLGLDAKTGKILWDTEVFRPNGDTIPAYYDRGSYASPTPVVEGKVLYAPFGHLGIAALDLDGKVLWRNTDLTFYPGFGSNGSSPIVLEDALFLSCDGADKQFVTALDRVSGKKVFWKTARSQTAALHVDKRYAFATPLLIGFNGKKQLISPAAGGVYAYDPATGEELWRVHYAGCYGAVPRPVFGHGLVFVTSGYDQPVLLAIRPDGRDDVTATHVAWTERKGAPLIASPLLVGDELYLASTLGIASCLDAKTGKIHWQERLGGSYYASPLSADGKVYFQNEEGVGTVVQAGKQFEVVSKNELAEQTLASYAAADSALFLRTEKHLYRIESKSTTSLLAPAEPAPAADPEPVFQETRLFDFDRDEALKAWSDLVPADAKLPKPGVKRERTTEHVGDGRSCLKRS